MTAIEPQSLKARLFERAGLQDATGEQASGREDAGAYWQHVYSTMPARPTAQPAEDEPITGFESAAKPSYEQVFIANVLDLPGMRDEPCPWVQSARAPSMLVNASTRQTFYLRDGGPGGILRETV